MRVQLAWTMVTELLLTLSGILILKFAADLLGRAADRGIDQFQPLPGAFFGGNLELDRHLPPVETAFQRSEPWERAMRARNGRRRRPFLCAAT